MAAMTLAASGSRRAYRIPARLNLAIAASVLALVPGTLWFLAQSQAPVTELFWIAAFVLLGHLSFALIHEAEHDKLHPHPRVNRLAGIALGALFPASFAVLRAGHLLHHARNRTNAELIDYYREDDERWLKTAKYYLLLAGAIWAGAVLFSVLLCFVPSRFFRLPATHEGDTNLSTYVAFLGNTRASEIRVETAYTALFWIALWQWLGLDASTLLAYGAFAVIWSSQQFVYHVRTPLHLVDGSWDLHLMPPVRWLFLNGNYHLTHHRHPRAPWTALPGLAGHAPVRSYLITWIRSFGPPLPISRAWPERFVASGVLPAGMPDEFTQTPR